MAKQTRQSQNTSTRSAPVLPPIPTNTPEGIRARAIFDTVRAMIDLPSQPDGLGLQVADVIAIGERLAVPPLFIESAYRDEDGPDSPATPKRLAEYVAWQQRLAAGKAVA